VRFENKRALKIFEKNGCQVDYSNNRVRFPEGLVEECLRKCPSSFRARARNPKNDMIWGGNTTYFQALAGTRSVDLNTWEPKTPTRKEYYDAVTVLNALENVHSIPWYTPWYGFKNVPPAMAMPEGLAARLRNSSKFTFASHSMGCEVFNIQMAQAVGTELRIPMSASPPLAYYNDAIEAGFRTIEAGFIFYISTGDIYGGTSPVTITGSLISINAEAIAGIVLAQLIKPGTRVIVSDFSFPQDMKSGSPAFGAIGISLHQVAFNQIRRKYGIPTDSGNYPNSKKIDYQAAYEKTTLALIAALSGTNTIWIQGAMYGELVFHPVQAILDDDIAGMIGRFIKGIEVNDETLAIDLINEVGPIPGHYLNKAHTRKWWKKEQFVPKVADRLTYPEWMKIGKKSCIDYAKERMDEILATHKVDPPLTESQEKEIERILKEAREYYKKKGLITDTEWKAYIQDLESSNYPYA